jgi:hypothetical protein
MGKKIRKFDAGGMASSSPQPAFTQFGGAPPAFGSGMAGGMANTADTRRAHARDDSNPRYGPRCAHTGYA